jgi:hypothetical protein
VRVARARACDPLALLDEPFWRVLWHFHHLTDDDARRALHDRMARVDSGFMTAFAVNQPASLAEEMQKVRAAIEEQERGPTPLDDLRARGEALAARMERGRVLDPDALVS